jgi:hypothetical protein
VKNVSGLTVPFKTLQKIIMTLTPKCQPDYLERHSSIISSTFFKAYLASALFVKH